MQVPFRQYGESNASWHISTTHRQLSDKNRFGVCKLSNLKHTWKPLSTLNWFSLDCGQHFLSKWLGKYLWILSLPYKTSRELVRTKFSIPSLVPVGLSTQAYQSSFGSDHCSYTHQWKTPIDGFTIHALRRERCYDLCPYARVLLGCNARCTPWPIQTGFKDPYPTELRIDNFIKHIDSKNWTWFIHPLTDD